MMTLMMTMAMKRRTTPIKAKQDMTDCWGHAFCTRPWSNR